MMEIEKRAVDPCFPSVFLDRSDLDVKEPLVRFSVAIGGELLDKFDRYREEHRYPNRSEAVRGLMRAALIEDAVASEDGEAMGVVTLIYDHHAGRISERLTELQHLHLTRVVTTTHVHLDARRCLEVILLRGTTKVVRELADGLIGTKGVETGRLVIASATAIGEGHGHHDHPHPHPHSHDH
jgi:CopG family transcriptional regulator, nickel-responsive regulator